MDALEAIFNRTSTRKFTDENISDDDLKTILTAAMSGPSAVNARDWSFVVVRDKDKLEKMADANVQFSEPLRGANVGILVCGDLDRAFPAAPDFWVIDGSIAAQNISIAAEAMGIGCVWLGVYPLKDRVENQTALFGLPETQIPHSILALGYPNPSAKKREKLLYEEDRVHFESW